MTSDLMLSLINASRADVKRIVKKLPRDRLEKAALAYLILVSSIIRTGDVNVLLDDMTREEAKELLEIATELQQSIDQVMEK